MTSTHNTEPSLPLSFVPDVEWNQRAMKTPLGPAHGGLVVDRSGRLYCSTDGSRSVIVFAPEGSVEREFSPQLAGIHAMTLVEENGEEFLLCANLLAHQVVKLTQEGRVVWSLGCPMESGLYVKPEEFKPTSVVCAPDGSLIVADGYGASVIHQFDAQRRYVKSFGGEAAGIGQLRNCHGLALDPRGSLRLLLVCDRRNRRLVHYDLEGCFVGIAAENLRRPCSLSFYGDFVAVAELEGRVVVLDRDNQITAVLGDNLDQTQWANYNEVSTALRPGVFAAPAGVRCGPGAR